MRVVLFINAMLLALFLGACAAPIRTDVTRFNALSPPRGETFKIVAKNPEKEGSLELQMYGSEVSKHLVAEGYRPAGKGEADLIVAIDFAVSEPMEEGYRARPAPYFGFSYFGRPYYPYGYPYYDPFGPYYDPFYGYGYSGLYSFRRWHYSYLYDTSDYRRIVYERAFEMTIRKNQGRHVFEGRAVSVGASNDLPKVVPTLIQALFTDFPGKNGETIRVTLKPDDGGGY